MFDKAQELRFLCLFFLKIKDVTKSSQKISTHPLTVLTTSAIT